MRVSDAILGSQQAFARDSLSPVLNLKHGGQHGLQPDLTTYVNNTPYVSKPMIAKLIEAPRGFRLLQEPDRWFETLKSLVEEHPKQISGIQFGLQTNWGESAVGGGGEQQEALTNVTQQRTQPVFTYDEKYNMSIHRFYNAWIRWLLADPNTKWPAIVSRNNSALTDLLPDFTGATILFFEPDPTFTKINKAVLTTNMHPKLDGNVEMTKDLTADGQMLELPIEFTGLSQPNTLGVRELAQRYLDEMNRPGMNPYYKPAFMQSISADVARSSNGVTESLNQAAQSMIR